MGLHLLWCFLLFLWHQQLLQGPLHFQNLKNFVAMPSVHNVRHVRLVYRWRKSAEPGPSIHLIHCPSIPDHLTDVLRSSQSHAAELTLWSVKLVSPVSPRRNSAKGTLTHMSALRSLITSHLILITATPLSGTLKSGMVRWVPRSAAGTVTGRISLSAMVVTRMIKLFCFCDYIPLAQAPPPFHFFHLITTRSRSKCTLCKITM